MKTAVLSFLAIALCLSAQSPGLKSDLQALRTGAPATPELTRQVSAHIRQLAQRSHEPSAATLDQFAGNLVAALAGHRPSEQDADGLIADIGQAMHSASTAGLDDAVKDFERRLMRAGVSAVRAHLTASNLERLGKESSGPGPGAVH
jgi:hypothetical protein